MSGRVDLRRVAPWVLCALSLSLFAVSGWLRWLLRNQEVAGDLPWLLGVIGALGFVGIPVVGALIAARLPANPYGWVWCGLGLAYAVVDLARPLARAVGWPLWVAWVMSGWAFVIFIGLFVFVFLLFPTGRQPSPPVAVVRPRGGDGVPAADGRRALRLRRERSEDGRTLGA